MKKIVFIQFAILLFALSSCEKNDQDDDAQPMRYVKGVNVSLDDVRMASSYEYDDLKRVTNIKNVMGTASSTTLLFKYEGRKTTIINKEDGTVNQYYITDEKGLVTERYDSRLYDSADTQSSSKANENNRISRTMTYAYDNNDYVTKIDEQETVGRVTTYGTYPFLWTAGNLAQVSHIRGNQEPFSSDVLTYANVSNHPNCNLDLSYLLATESRTMANGLCGVLGVVGQRCKNLPEKVVVTFEDGSKYEYTYKYTLDNDGYVIKVEETIKDHTDEPTLVTTEIEYY